MQRFMRRASKHRRISLFFIVAGLAAPLAPVPGCAGAGAARVARLERALEAEERAVAPAEAAPPFPGASTLERGALVAEVLRRNPSIASARHAWRAALARHPQESGLDDPMFGYGIGPRTFGSDDAPQLGQRFELSQALPLPGKRALRGAAALGEAEAAEHELGAVRLRLATMASTLFDDYWLLARSLEVTRRHLALVGELLQVAVAGYEAGFGTQQDPLRVELEQAELLHREIELAAEQRITAQQLALLLHLRHGGELPPPPPLLSPVLAPTPAETAVEEALAARPELRAADARVAAGEAGEALARREFLPDFRVMAVYDRFWEISDLQPMLGVELNVPLQIGRRRAALAEARAERGIAESERARLRDEVESEVRSARERLAEAQHLLGIARDRLLPASRDRLAAARAEYEAGRAEFEDVIEAERALRDAELADLVALADTSRRAAELAAALGVVPGLAPQETTHDQP